MYHPEIRRIVDNEKMYGDVRFINRQYGTDGRGDGGTGAKGRRGGVLCTASALACGRAANYYALGFGLVQRMALKNWMRQNLCRPWNRLSRICVENPCCCLVPMAGVRGIYEAMGGTDASDRRILCGEGFVFEGAPSEAAIEEGRQRRRHCWRSKSSLFLW